MAIRRSDDVTFEVVDGRALLVDPDGGAVITLNPVGTLVWGALDGTREVPDVVDHVRSRVTAVSGEQLEPDVRAFIEELRVRQLVVELE